MPRDGQPRILIVRLSAIGDVIHALPVLCALRNALPNAYLSWVVEGRAADLLTSHPALDALVVLPRGWLKSPRLAWQARTALRALHCNVAIDVQGLTKSAIAAKFSGARRRIGFAGPDGRELSQWINNERILPTRQHVIDRNLELLQTLIVWPTLTASERQAEESSARCQWENVEYQLPELPADAALAESILSRNGLRRGFAVINPGAGWTSKLWPAERFAEVARHLGARCGLPSLIVWGGEKERYLAAQISSEASGHAILAPTTSLTELSAIVRRAQLFVSADTGPLHLAAALQTPCVGLFGPVAHERNGPYGAQHISVQKARLQGGSRARRNAGPESMQAIEVEHVIKACETILSRRVSSFARPA